MRERYREGAALAYLTDLIAVATGLGSEQKL